MDTEEVEGVLGTGVMEEGVTENGIVLYVAQTIFRGELIVLNVKHQKILACQDLKVMLVMENGLVLHVAQTISRETLFVLDAKCQKIQTCQDLKVTLVVKTVVEVALPEVVEEVVVEVVEVEVVEVEVELGVEVVPTAEVITQMGLILVGVEVDFRIFP